MSYIYIYINLSLLPLAIWQMLSSDCISLSTFEPPLTATSLQLLLSSVPKVAVMEIINCIPQGGGRGDGAA